MQVDDYDYDGYKRHSKAEAVQCRTCGKIHYTINELIAQHWVDNGCPDCQRRYTAVATRLMTNAGLTDESIEAIFKDGLNNG